MGRTSDADEYVDVGDNCNYILTTYIIVIRSIEGKLSCRADI